MSSLAILGLFYGTLAMFGILGEFGWWLDDYSRDLPPSFLEGATPSNLKGNVHASCLQKQSKGTAR